MQTQRINISLPYSIVRHLNQAIAKGKRSRFIASALSEKLAKKRNIEKELRKSLRANYKLDREFIKDWSVTEVEGWPE